MISTEKLAQLYETDRDGALMRVMTEQRNYWREMAEGLRRDRDALVESRATVNGYADKWAKQYRDKDQQYEDLKRAFSNNLELRTSNLTSRIKGLEFDLIHARKAVNDIAFRCTSYNTETKQ